MHEPEKQQATHLLILLSYTMLCIALIGESLLLGWNMEAIVLVVLGLVISWSVHITEKIPPAYRLWIYFGFSMMTFFFYGIHETSMYDLAATMTVVIMLYSAAESFAMILLCVVIYFLTMCYDFLFVMNPVTNLTPLAVTRTILHFLLVCLASWLVRKTLYRHNKERQHTEDKIHELEEINRRTENFLTNVSHELRTPINAVTGIAALMQKSEEDENRKKDIRSIQKAGGRLAEQIEDILDYTEIDTGKITVIENGYMISSLINNIITELHLQEADSELEMIFDIDAGIPAELIGDEKKIKKILRHLIDNAVKFTEKGGVYVRIYALKKPYGINLCISVSDTGSGIAEADLKKLRERFYQVNDGRNRRAGGLGLGLPIVYGMAAALEGFMKVESVPGEGTTMSVSIPQKVADEAPGIDIAHRQELCMAYFMQPEKFKIPKLRTYYDSMISNMVRELGVSLRRIYHVDELKKLVDAYRLTHLFTGEQEYQENEDFFESIDPGIKVIVVAKSSFVLPRSSRARVLKKPFSVMGVANILNSDVLETIDEFKIQSMTCPGIRVLVVDDEPMNLMVAEGIFSDYQMQVTTADSGFKAIELCEKENFDLIFLDHMMPEMDGVETLKRIRKIFSAKKDSQTIIAFTANAVSGARNMFLKEGFDEFVSKPIEFLELERILRKVLPKSAIVYAEEQTGNSAAQPMDAKNMEDRKDIEGIEEIKNIGEIKKGNGRMSLLEKGGIHTKSGMQYCGNDETFYEELLLNFAKSAGEKAEKINNYYEREAWNDYAIFVHAMKSTARMVGADELSVMAEKSEAAAKISDADYIKAHHKELMERYLMTVQYILEVLVSEKAAVQKQNDREIGKEELMQYLKQLAESLKTFEADKAEQIIMEISGMLYQGEIVDSLFTDIREDIDNFELDAALEKAAHLRERVEGNEAE